MSKETENPTVARAKIEHILRACMEATPPDHPDYDSIQERLRDPRPVLARHAATPPPPPTRQDLIGAAFRAVTSMLPPESLARLKEKDQASVEWLMNGGIRMSPRFAAASAACANDPLVMVVLELRAMLRA